MAYTMKTCLPCEVVSKIVQLGSELKMKERLKNGWAIIHDEMMWRESHVYSCAHHFCDVQDCNCYHRFPGFLLRRVDSGAWLPGLGETRYGLDHRHAQWNQPEVSNAIWFDLEANEMGLLNSNIPVAPLLAVD